MHIRINVTQADIRAGIRTACGHCPIALAARRALPGRTVEVFGGDMHIAVSAEMLLQEVAQGRMIPRKQIIGLPHEARCFVYDFDAGNTVEPFAFGIELN